MELFPTAAKILVEMGGIKILCEKMQNFEYAEIAENSIKAIEKLSMVYGQEVLKNDTITIILNIIDFFFVNIQVA